MPVLYVVEQGAQLGREGQRLVVRRGPAEVSATPVHRVEQVVLVGRIQPTCGALDLLLQHGLPLHYLSSDGRLKGSFEPPVGRNVLLRRRQYQRAEEGVFRLQVSRAIVGARLGAQRLACLRWGRNHGLAEADTAAAELQRLAEESHQAAAEALLGLEGRGTRLYYGVLRRLVAPHLPFPRRTRRPARDPVSALLNLAAGLLRVQVLTALQLVGLDPYQGFYHTLKYGRPALALDLMEEFRTGVAEAAAVAAINRQAVGPDAFQERQGVWLLTEEALEGFIELFERRLQEEVTHPLLGRRATYRECLRLQARLLARAVLGELPAYAGFLLEH